MGNSIKNEIELKFLEISIEKTKKDLLDLGAKLEWEGYLESWTFQGKISDNPEGNLSPADATKPYLRLRKLGNNETILTYKGKKQKNTKFKIREEQEVIVSDFNTTVTILEKLGYIPYIKDVKYRYHFSYTVKDNPIHFEIDIIDDIPPFLEIETHSEKDMKAICKKLDLDISKGKGETIPKLYPEKFNK